MTDEMAAEGLLWSTPMLLGSSFAVSFVVCLWLCWRNQQSIYKAIIASVIIMQFSCSFPFVYFLLYTGQSSLSSEYSAAASALRFSLLLFPQAVVILIIAFVVAIRHRQSLDVSYRVEAIVALVTAVVGSAWTTIFLAALTVAH